MFIPRIGCNKHKYMLIASYLFAELYGTGHKMQWEDKNLSGTVLEGSGSCK